jgi:hypothetical protein
MNATFAKLSIDNGSQIKILAGKVLMDESAQWQSDDVVHYPCDAQEPAGG